MENLNLVGSDSTSSMTGVNNGAIRCMEEIIYRPLQWAICLLHLNELPLRHVFITLDGTTKSPDAFSGPIGSNLGDTVSNWEVVNFKKIPNPNFPILPNDVIDDLSTDQFNAYRICSAVMLGTLDPDLSLLEIGPMCHSRWLTLACRILRYYVSRKNPDKNLITLAEFCILVYFPSWFTIKRSKYYT